MSTEEERLAKKELQILELRTEIEKVQKRIYRRFIGQIETPQQKALFRRYRSLNLKLDRLDANYQKKFEELTEERDRIFEELNNSFE